jgi:K+-sensing histidine kinase KdpD
MGRAIRFTTNGTITIRSWEDESILHISVTKTGDTNGIRGNIDQTKGVPGARQESQPELPDLDLAIASHLIHLHGGELELEDDAGRMAIIRLSARIPSDQITADPIPETHTSPATGQAPGALPPA